MEAAQFHPDSVTIKLGDIPIPEPRDDKGLVRTITSGLFHTDLVYMVPRNTGKLLICKQMVLTDLHRLFPRT